MYFLSLAFIISSQRSLFFSFFAKPDKYNAANKDELSAVTLLFLVRCDMNIFQIFHLFAQSPGFSHISHFSNEMTFIKVCYSHHEEI